MFDFSKLQTIKVWRVYRNNCPVSGCFDFGEKDEAIKLAEKLKECRVVLEYMTILQA